MLRGLSLCLLVMFLPIAGSATEARGHSGDTRDRTGGQTLSDALTRSVIRQIDRDTRACAGTARDWRADCYKYALRLAAQALEGNRAYRTAHTALDRADRNIGAYVSERTEWSRVPVLHGLQIYRPVAPDQGAQSIDAAIAAFKQAESAILSAPEDTGAQYQRLAAALAAGATQIRVDADQP